MSMFTRSDRVSDPNPNAKPQATATTAPAAAPLATAAPEPKRATASVPTGMVSIISKALRITGQLESTEDIQIEGEVNGDVRAATVKVGNNARVKGSVYGDEVELAGTVEGKIEARKVILASTAHMSGDVIHQDIRIESGAYMNGHCRPDYGKIEPPKAITVPAKPAVREPVNSGKPNEARPVAPQP
jgi:cytoskeletal protein CcmA (bactofilin family)